MLLVSPAEPPALRALGVSHTLPEERGADYVLPAAGQLLCVQRKTVDDFLASLADGRLERELAVLRRQFSALLIEGRPEWSSTGLLIHRRKFTVDQWWGALFSIAWEFEIQVLQTAHMAETAGLLRALEHWFAKGVHNSLRKRPNASALTGWGRASDRDWSRHLLQSFPGVGVTLADAIYDAFHRAPLAWSCSKAELGAIDGIGPMRLHKLWQALDR